MDYCDYGCGKEAKYKQSNGKMCCSKHYAQCSNLREKNSKSNKGRVVTDETKNKIRQKHKGKQLTEEHKRKISHNHADFSGEKHPMFGKHHSQEAKHKISIANKGKKRHTIDSKKKISKAMSGINNPMFGRERPEMTGCNNPNWKGGISNNPYCSEFLNKEFRSFITERDNNKCLNPCCEHKSDRLTIHHIDYNKRNCTPLNLICLCNSCNAKANKDREWHTSWYKAIIYQRYNKGVNN